MEEPEHSNGLRVVVQGSHMEGGGAILHVHTYIVTLFLTILEHALQILDIN